MIFNTVAPSSGGSSTGGWLDISEDFVVGGQSYYDQVIYTNGSIVVASFWADESTYLDSQCNITDYAPLIKTNCLAYSEDLQAVPVHAEDSGGGAVIYSDGEFIGGVTVIYPII